MRRWLATMGCRLLCSAGLGASWSFQGPCWQVKILAWLVVIHAVTLRSCVRHVNIGASQGAPLWYSQVPAGNVTCELYCMSGKKPLWLSVEQYHLFFNSIEKQLISAYAVTTHERVIMCKEDGLVAGQVSDIKIKCSISSPLIFNMALFMTNFQKTGLMLVAYHYPSIDDYHNTTNSSSSKKCSSVNHMAASLRLQVQSWIFSSFIYFSSILCAVNLKVLGL